ncbi:hypothetical protein OUZ56_023711 [Daphnia magna]|uniref:Uncharacterized protein n=1 Tax=Daphnia magna TaxID=35525 RepID=A0ABR0AZE8_9CRUS|nr:hypothetical protein OUZ56_023711 [Daphnia magna]
MSNESITERREFARFNGINFPQFRYAIMLELKVLRLENIVLGTEPRPHQCGQSNHAHVACSTKPVLLRI